MIHRKAAKHKRGGPLRPAVLLALAALPLAMGAGDVRRGGDPFDDEPNFLPVEQAFVFAARLEVEPARRLVARWTMPDGYYLYRHKVAFEADGPDVLGELAIADGEHKVDDYFGEVEVYYHGVEASVAVRQRKGVLAARVSYQGCADYGLCYPLQTRTVAFDAATGRAVVP